MSNALAIAAATAVLKDLLNDGLLNHDLSVVGSFSVTASPPDRIAIGQNEPNRLNLFLYQVTANLGWRNADLPSRDSNGARISNPPLALDLHYMLTAYGSADLNAEILLGYAMQLLHETPILTRDQLRTVLGGAALVDGSILPSPFGTLSALDLADQVELIKISPVYLSTEDLSSKMWTAMQARYRPTMAYLVSVALIQSTAPVRSNAPVLRRGKDDTGPSTVAGLSPNLTGARPAASDLLPALRLGDDLLLTGGGLPGPGAVTALLENTDAGRKELPIALSAAPPGVTVHVPSIAEDADAMNEWVIGLYSAKLSIAIADTPSFPSNAVSFVFGPRITVAPLAASAGDIVTITCSPRVLAAQESQTTVLLGSQSAPPISITSPADPLQPTTITFEVPAMNPGTYMVRLRVMGIDSVPAVVKGSRLEVDPNQQVTVA